MKTINEIIKRVQTLEDRAQKKNYKLFWLDIEDIIDAKIYDYKIRMEETFPVEILIDIFDGYVEKYKAENAYLSYDKQSVLNKQLAELLKLYNEGVSKKDPYKPETFLIDDKAWQILHRNANDKEKKGLIKNFDYRKGASYADVLQRFKVIKELNASDNFTRDGLNKAWMFFRKYIFRIIPDNGLIVEDDILDCVQLMVDMELPNIKFDHHQVGLLKQQVSNFNLIFGTSITYDEVGLGYDQLREKFPEKDGWIQTEEDKKTLKELRKITHHYFDLLWQGHNGKEPLMKRTEAYRWLGDILRKKIDDSHIALLNESECALTILESIKKLS